MCPVVKRVSAASTKGRGQGFASGNPQSIARRVKNRFAGRLLGRGVFRWL
jgi:hypothetical protein